MPLIEVKSLTFSYPKSHRVILNDCNFVINEGEIVSLLGPNGAGKSTLMNCLCGLLKVDNGHVIIDGNDINTLSDRKISRYIAYVQQTQEITFPYTVFEYILMGRANRLNYFQRPTKEDREFVQNVMKDMKIEHLANSLITEVSGGEKQQAAIARAVVQEPKVVFFDEPTAHLDYGNQMRTLNLIKKLNNKGYTVLMTTHTPDHCIILGGKVAVINKDGVINHGDSEKLINEKLLKDIYGINVKMRHVEDVDRLICIPEDIDNE